MEKFGYEKLEIWQLGMQITELIYALSRQLPKDETYGLISQIRRASVSIPSNIAEGFGRGSTASFAQSVRIARGSAYELRTQIELIHRLEYLPQDSIEELNQQLVLLSKKLDAFIKSLATNE